MLRALPELAYRAFSLREVGVPLYRITLSCSQIPHRQTSRSVELPDLQFARELAELRLDIIRARTYVGTGYDTWRVSRYDDESGRHLVLAENRAR